MTVLNDEYIEISLEDELNISATYFKYNDINNEIIKYLQINLNKVEFMEII